ncbi:MAG TPA: amidohydrolase family protein [Thermomicrobiales bacterium]|nr:amidohydrolase family protein [Thermomicrobiales bacterium]
MTIVDAHTHLFPPAFIRDRAALAAREPWFDLAYGDGRARMATGEDLVASMDAAGIAGAVACGWPWRDPGLCRAHNDYLLDAARRYPDRLRVLAIVSPADSRAAAEAGRCLDAGAAGLGELNADAQGFDLAAPAPLAPLAEVLTARGRPLLLHASEPLGHPYPGKGTATPEKLVAFLLAYPDLRVVAAHWGGGLPFYELMPEVAAAARNLWYDSAASTYLYHFAVFPRVAALVGPARILWATDYPLLKQAPFLRRTRESGLDAPALAAILGENARRLYWNDE